MNKANEIMVVAPSASAQTFFKTVKYEHRFQNAKKVVSKFCHKLSFSQNAFEMNDNSSSSISSRVDDLHYAFENKNVDVIMCARGGYNCNELLRYLNWNLIRKNPKIFIGFSDITVLCNAIYQMSGLPTYLGYSFIDYGRDDLNPNVILNTQNIIKHHSVHISMEEAIVFNYGESEGTCIGGNLSSFMLLKGTPYMPKVDNPILLIESDYYLAGGADRFFIRNLYSLIQDNLLNNLKGIIIGQFEEDDNINLIKLKHEMSNITELKNIPIIANIKFSHKYPSEIFKIGGKIAINASPNDIEINYWNRQDD